jgi:hypothetical protein
LLTRPPYLCLLLCNGKHTRVPYAQKHLITFQYDYKTACRWIYVAYVKSGFRTLRSNIAGTDVSHTRGPELKSLSRHLKMTALARPSSNCKRRYILLSNSIIFFFL